MSEKRLSAKIIGTGMYVPDRIVTNKELGMYIETSNEWIVEKTGIKERRIAKLGELPSDIATKSSFLAIKNAGINVEDIDLIILAITNPDVSVPSTASIVQKKIGAKNAFSFDIRNSCQGFVTALIVAWNLLSNGVYNNALIVGTCNHGSLLNSVNWRDRTKAIFFGDGSGAIILKRCGLNEGILSFDSGTDYLNSEALNLAFGGFQTYIEDNAFLDKILGDPMDGKKIFDFSITEVPLSIKKALEKANLKTNDLDFVILHQANINIIRRIMENLNLPMEKTYTNIEEYGNTSEASIPIALHEALKEGKIKSGDLVVLSGFGAGLGWATVVMKW